MTIPPNLMHTFRTSNNKIIYSVRVEGVIRFWPDVSEQFEFSVLPPPLSSSPSSIA